MKRFLAILSLFALVGAVPALAQDADGDGVLDANDNCIDVPNASQDDNNYDGYGKLCDPDYYNDGVVNDIDFELFVECLTAGSPDCDLNGDGVTTAGDFNIFRNYYGGPPGPSGLTCAGSIPCSDPSVVGDLDGDGVGDDIDNCVDRANPAQADRNADAFGDRCDPDFDNDGTVDDVDVEIFRSCVATGSPDCDLNGDGVTTAGDFSIFRNYYGGPPGPAGPGSQDSCPCEAALGNCP